jgi:Na+/H+ antiporter NhaC
MRNYGGGIMLKNLDFILRSLIIYITLGVAICATTQLFSRYTHYPHLIAYIAFACVIDRLFRYDKEKDIKLFKCINIVFINFLITGITILFIELLHLI